MERLNMISIIKYEIVKFNLIGLDFIGYLEKEIEERRILSELSKSIKSKKKLKINEPNNLRDYMAIEDVVKLFIRLFLI